MKMKIKFLPCVEPDIEEEITYYKVNSVGRARQLAKSGEYAQTDPLIPR